MELKLKIYKGKKVVKEYTTDTIDCSYGVVEDVLDVLDFENMKTGNNAELAAMVVKCAKQLKPFLKDMFDGVTDEEIRCTRMQNLIEIFKGLYKYATHELGLVIGDEKN
jgi:hypothetical protein